MLYKEITLDDFINEFQKWETRKDQFSHEALEAIYEYISDAWQDVHGIVELDVVAICCEFTEYNNAKEYHKEYNATTPEEKEEQEDYIIAYTDSKSIVAINH